MIDLMSAAEAKNIIANMDDEKSKRLQLQAKEKIEAAVSQGLTSVYLSIDHSHKHRMTAWLEKLGYSVKSGPDQRDGDWFQVSW